MTEHVALVPLMGTVYLLTCGEETTLTFFSVGLLMAIASLVRLNLAYTVVALGVYIAARSWRLFGSDAANRQIERDPPAASELRCVMRPKR